MYSTKGKRGKSKPLKDPEAPKKPLSSFIHFCMKERSNVQKELLNTDRLLNCNTVSAKVTKELGKRWATLDSEMRKVYEEASLKDRKRYEMEKKIYKPSKEFLKKKAEFEDAPKFSSIKSPIPKATETVADHFEDYFNFLHINWKKVQLANPGFSINQTQTEVLRLWLVRRDQKPDECVSITKIPKKDNFKNNGESKKKTFSSKKEKRVKFVPNKPWIPFKTQVSVQQVCQYLEMKDVLIKSTPALRITCRDRKFFNELARPLARKANPDAHPYVMATFLRAKWFELMNTEDAEEVEEEEEHKRKRENKVEDAVKI